MKEKAIIKEQHYQYDCGAACLCSIAQYYGIYQSLAQLRIYCGCTQYGISIQGIIEGCNKIGLNAKGYKSPDNNYLDISNIAIPFIAHIKAHNGYYHYIVVYKTEKDWLQIMDPANTDNRRISVNDFVKIWTGYVIVITPALTAEIKQNKPGTKEKILSILFNNKKEIALSFAGATICTITSLSISFLLQQTIDKIIPSHNIVHAAILSASIIVLMAASIYIAYKSTQYIINCSVKIDTTLIVGYIQKLFKLSPSFFDNYRAGDIASRIDDAFKIRSFITDGIIGILTSIITVIGTVVIMFCYNFKLALVISIFIPLYVILYKQASKINKKYSRKLACAGATFNSNLLDCINGINSIRHYGMYNISVAKIEESYINLANNVQQAGRALNVFGSSSDAISKALICIVFTIGSLTVLRNSMTIGELVGFYSLCSFFTIPLNALVNSNGIISQTTIACERLFEIIELPDELQNKNYINFNELSPVIKIEQLHFKYAGRENLFDGINVTINPGEITALKGNNGCGKSTLAKLILMDYTPTKGCISYGGININKFNPKLWRDNIAYVNQKSHLFNASILDNITSGNPNPDMNYVLEICNNLSLLEMLKKLPMGLLTQVGQEGNALSGGECQKICIARAMYKNPSIFIFDEITSNMDNSSESVILNSILKLKDSGKTMILITHKDSNLKIADTVVEI